MLEKFFIVFQEFLRDKLDKICRLEILFGKEQDYLGENMNYKIYVLRRICKEWELRNFPELMESLFLEVKEFFPPAGRLTKGIKMK